CGLALHAPTAHARTRGRRDRVRVAVCGGGVVGGWASRDSHGTREPRGTAPGLAVRGGPGSADPGPTPEGPEGPRKSFRVARGPCLRRPADPAHPAPAPSPPPCC